MTSFLSLGAQRVLTAVGVAALLSLTVACGGSSNSVSGPGLGSGVNNSMLHGQYAFSFSGQLRSSGAVMSGVGMFTADGNGNISGGMQDANIGNGSHTFNFTGKYSVGSDLRGTAILSGLQVCSNWQFTMLNASHALMTCFDSATTASGSIDIQDTTAFSAAKLTGNYVFGISGAGIGGGVTAMAGDWSMNGQGGITSGEVDVNDTGSVLQDIALTGTYTVNSNGRGTLTLTSNAYRTQNFVFYVVNATNLKLLESDALSSTTPFTSGEVLTMAAPPFNLASFNGRYAFTLGGADFNGVATGSGGVFASDGNGNLNGVLDDNDGGGLTLSQPFNGTYTMSSTGRASLTFAFFNLAAYPAANGSAELVELDANGVSAGMAKAQANTSFSTASVSGTYAMNWAGTLNPAPSVLTFPSEEDITGQLTADGTGNLGGTLDVNSVSNILQGLPVSQSNYSMTGNGHGGATINTQVATFNMQLYQVDANTVLFVDTDPNRVMVGLMQKQQ